MPPPREEDSPAGAGWQEVSYKVGEGVFNLFIASIENEVNYNQPAKISFVYIHGDGEESELVFHAGKVIASKPLTLPQPRKFEGPGYIRGSVLNAEATNTFTFRVNYVQEVVR